MNELITAMLVDLGINEKYLEMSAIGVGFFIILFVSTISYYIAKNQIIKVAHKLIVKTKNTWDDALIEHNVLTRLTLLLPFIIILFLTPLIFPEELLFAELLILFSKIFLTFQVAHTVS